MAAGVPQTLIYGEKPHATAASKVRQNFLPINGRNFGPANQVHFSIACGRRGAYLDPKATFLKFKLVNKEATGGVAVKIDGSAHSVIELLEIYAGNTQLEYLRGYSSCVQMLMDSQASTDRLFKNGNILEGMDEVTLRLGEEIPVGESRTYCLPILSGIIGSMAERMLPVGSLTRDNLKVSITLADKLDLTFASAAWEITDVELVCEYVMINDTVARTLEAMNPNGIIIPFSSLSLQSNSIPAGVSSINLLLSGNFRSVKTLFTIFRLDSNKNSAASKYVTNRTNPIQADGSWAYDISGFKVPQQKVVGSVETFMELQKAFHNFNSVEGHGIHTNTSWNKDDHTSTFVIGVDLDHFSAKSDVSRSGVDISTSMCYLQAQFSGVQKVGGTNVALRADTYFHYDARLEIASDGSGARTVV